MHWARHIDVGSSSADQLAGAAFFAEQPNGFLAGPGKEGLISAIVPAFNRQELVVDAIESLASQSYPEIQIVVVDDGSTDDTAQVVREWAAAHPDQRIDLVCQSNRGVAGARNAGLMRAEGEFIYFLDSDDVAEPAALNFMVEALQNALQSPFALASVCNTDIHGTVLSTDCSGLRHLGEPDFLRNYWLLFAALYRRTALRRAGPFNENLEMGEDMEINWRVLIVNGGGVCSNVIIGKRRHHLHGHLYIDSDDTQRMYISLQMHRALGDWLAEHPEYRNRVTARGLWAVYNYYQQLGLHQSEVLWVQVAEIFDLLSRQTPRTNLVLRWLSHARNRPLYRLPYRVYRALRADAVRAFASKLMAPHRRGANGAARRFVPEGD